MLSDRPEKFFPCRTRVTSSHAEGPQTSPSEVSPRTLTGAGEALCHPDRRSRPLSSSIGVDRHKRDPNSCDCRSDQAARRASGWRQQATFPPSVARGCILRYQARHAGGSGPRSEGSGEPSAGTRSSLEHPDSNTLDFWASRLLQHATPRAGAAGCRPNLNRRVVCARMSPSMDTASRLGMSTATWRHELSLHSCALASRQVSTIFTQSVRTRVVVELKDEHRRSPDVCPPENTIRKNGTK